MINPMNIIGSALNDPIKMQNPMFSNAVNLYKNGDSQGLENLARNICQQKGIDINSIMRQLGAK